MPIDYDAIIAKATAIKQEMDTIIRAANLHRRPNLRVDAATVIPYTADQKARIIAVYQAAKDRARALFLELP